MALDSSLEPRQHLRTQVTAQEVPVLFQPRLLIRAMAMAMSIAPKLPIIPWQNILATMANIETPAHCVQATMDRKVSTCPYMVRDMMSYH